jgi:hypothetical protein
LEKFRNLAYLFLIIVMMITGFMIMFRQKMGQTAVTFQQAIPNVVIALITITFSYAIAGLLIDLMYLIMFLMLRVFNPDASVIGLGGNLEGDGLISSTIFEIGASMILGEEGAFTNTYFAVGNFVKSIIPFTGDVLPFFAGLSAAFVVVIAIAIGTFRLFFELLMTYVNIIISIIMSPIMLMLGAIPGRNAFVPWLKSLFGNLMAFPIVLLLLIIYVEIVTGSNPEMGSSGGFRPPYLIGSGNPDAITSMVGIAILLILTDLVKQGKKMMGATNPFENLTQAVQSSLKQGWKGGQLVPGLGFTDTSKYGLSGKSISRTVGVGAGSLAAGVPGVVGAGILKGFTPGMTRAEAGENAKKGFRAGARTVADLSGSGFMKENRKEREKTPWYHVRRKAQQAGSKEGK